jgi:anti-anti-sigma regulatory factor/anti-sigma regulatory factor (Ser/Thr protein kinase)
MILNILSSSGITVPLPFRLNRETIYSLVNSVLDKDLTPKANKVVFDFSSLSFVEPAGITVLSNLIEVLKKNKVKTSFSGLSYKPSIHYLNDSGFFKHYLQKEIHQKPTLRGTTLPLELVSYSKSYQYMDCTLIPWLAKELCSDSKSLATAKSCFHEIFNNIQDHSQVNIGCSFAQHYPKNHELQISISDFGVGIPTNVRKKDAELNDQQAIAKACSEGYTTQTTPRNRGAGLHVLIQNVAKRNKGTIIINSLSGIASFTNTPDGVKGNVRSAAGNYPGTLIQIILDTRKFMFDAHDEDFEW